MCSTIFVGELVSLSTTFNNHWIIEVQVAEEGLLEPSMCSTGCVAEEQELRRRRRQELMEKCSVDDDWSNTVGSMVNMPNTLTRSCFQVHLSNSRKLSSQPQQHGWFEHEWVISKVSAHYKAGGFFYAESVEIVRQ